MQGYEFAVAQIPALLALKYIPEQPPPEAAVIRAWLTARAHQYDRFLFSARVGGGQTPNPDHEPGVQRSTEFSTQKRIDVVAFQGGEVTLVESKKRLSADAHGKLLMYRQLYLEEFPDANEPRLVAIAAYADPTVLRIFGAHGIDVYLYDDAIAP